MLLALPGCGSWGAADEADDALVLYCGRGRSLVEPTIERFREETGINVKVRYGQTAQLAVTILEEGERSPADLFWAQDAGALGQLTTAGRLEPLPEDLLEAVPAPFRHTGGYWVGTSGRARVMAYSVDRVEPADLPDSVFGFTDEKWRGRVGWAPTNGSFQAFVTAMRQMHGDDAVRDWLEAMKANGAQPYPKNSPILTALAAGEIDVGLTNHYYLLRFKQDDPQFPVEQTGFADADVGNLMLVAGVGVLDTVRNRDAALKFIRFLLSSETAQAAFANDDFEYPVSADVAPRPELPGQDRLDGLTPDVPLDALDDLEGTLRLLREVGLL